MTHPTDLHESRQQAELVINGRRITNPTLVFVAQVLGVFVGLAGVLVGFVVTMFSAALAVLMPVLMVLGLMLYIVVMMAGIVTTPLWGPAHLFLRSKGRRGFFSANGDYWNLHFSRDSFRRI